MILQNSFDVLNSITDYLEENKIILSPLENTYLSSLFESSWALPIEGVQVFKNQHMTSFKIRSFRY